MLTSGKKELVSGSLASRMASILIALRLLDSAVVLGVSLYLFSFELRGRSMAVYWTLIILGMCLTSLMLTKAKLYRLWRRPSFLHEGFTLTRVWLHILATMALGMFGIEFFQMAPIETTRVLTSPQTWLWASLCPLLMIGGRFLLRTLLRGLTGKPYPERKALIVGAGPAGRKMLDAILMHYELGYEVMAFIDDDPSLAGTSIKGVPVLTSLSALAEHINKMGVEDVFITKYEDNEEISSRITAMLGDTTADSYFVPNVHGLALLKPCAVDLAGMPVVSLGRPSCADEASQVLKWLEDKTLALLIILLLSPLFAAIAIAVKLSSSGPVIFKQRRHGLNGEIIQVYKFRTMRVVEDGTDVRQATKDDPRVTRIGALLRKTSLDELPQFFNVLKGDMSLVGPRPHAIHHTEIYRKQVSAYMHRLKMKPGITGLAQINGFRGEVRSAEMIRRRVEYDLAYITNWSILLDIKIILLTLTRGFIHKNAY